MCVCFTAFPCVCVSLPPLVCVFHCLPLCVCFTAGASNGAPQQYADLFDFDFYQYLGCALNRNKDSAAQQSLVFPSVAALRRGPRLRVTPRSKHRLSSVQTALIASDSSEPPTVAAIARATGFFVGLYMTLIAGTEFCMLIKHLVRVRRRGGRGLAGSFFWGGGGSSSGSSTQQASSRQQAAGGTAAQQLFTRLISRGAHAAEGCRAEPFRTRSKSPRCRHGGRPRFAGPLMLTELSLPQTRFTHDIFAFFVCSIYIHDGVSCCRPPGLVCGAGRSTHPFYSQQHWPNPLVLSAVNALPPGGGAIFRYRRTEPPGLAHRSRL